MMKKIMVLLTTVVLSFALTGCASYDEVYDKNYLRAISFEENTNKKVVFSFYDNNAELLSESGSSFDEIRSNAELECGKTIFTGHTELIILGECDYAETLTFLLKVWKVSPSCLVAYGGKQASELLNSDNSEELADSVRKAVEQGISPKCDIITVLSGLLGNGKSAEIAEITENGIKDSHIINLR